MGFGIVNTLSYRAIKEIRKNAHDRLILPANIDVSQRITSFPVNEISGWFRGVMNALRWLPGIDHIMPVKKKEWIFETFLLDMKKKGNIITLGGNQKEYKQYPGIDMVDQGMAMGKNPGRI